MRPSEGRDVEEIIVSTPPNVPLKRPSQPVNRAAATGIRLSVRQVELTSPASGAALSGSSSLTTIALPNVSFMD